MAKKKREIKQSLVLYGEGDTEEIFLNHIKQIYAQHLKNKSLKVGSGNGGSPGSVLLSLEKKILVVGDPTVPVLVLLDEDKTLDKEAEKVCRKYPNIQISFSRPECLEGLLLDLLQDLPKGGSVSETYKNHFQDKYLGSRNQTKKLLKQKCQTLFPIELLKNRRENITVLQEIYQFLGLKAS
jgi:predicted ATP-dependent endonuclease of OLD family